MSDGGPKESPKAPSRRVETFGDVTAEYLALRNAAGLVSGHHDLVAVQGPDAVTFLQGIISQDVAGMAVDSVARSFLLGPEGKLRALLWVLKGDGEVLLVTDGGRGPDLASELARYRFRVDVTITAVVEAVVGVWGPTAAEVLDRGGLPFPQGWARREEAVVAALPVGGLLRYLVAGINPALLEAAGARPAGVLAVTAVRVEAGEPVMGWDVDEKTIPQETGLVAETVSFTKGCYLGQELVARIDSRGHVNRKLRGIIVGTNRLPPERAELRADGKRVGAITSIAESLTLRAPVGLALVRREIQAGSQVEVHWEGGSAPASVHELPLSNFTES